jgi:hypothetical protein
MSTHSTPLPVYPALQAHVKLLLVFVHVAWSWHESSELWHSSTSVHVTPDPVQPTLHEHRNEPATSTHDASAWQSSRLFVVHSTTFSQLTPDPV